MNIDDFFGKKLNELGNPDSAADWAAMEAMLDAKKKGGWLASNKLVVVVLLIGICGLVCWLQYGAIEDKNTTTALQETELNESSSIIDPVLMDSIDGNKESKNDNQSTNVIEESANDLTFSTSSQTSKKTKSAQAVISETLIENNGIKRTSDVQEVKETTTVVPREQTIVSKQVENVVLENAEMSDSPIDPAKESTAETVDETTTNTQVSQPYIVPVQLYAKYIEEIYKADIMLGNKHLAIAGVPMPSKKWQCGIGSYMGAYDYQRSKPQGTQANKEQMQNAYRYGINGAAYKNNWKINLGLGATQMREQNTYVAQEYSYTYDTSYALVDRNFDQTPTGRNRALIAQKVEVSSVDSTEYAICESCKTTFSYIDIPLSVQYQFGKSRMKFIGEIGGGLSILTRANGYYTLAHTLGENGSYEVGPVEKTDLNRVLYNGNAALGLSYRINSKLTMYSSYGMRWYQTSMTKNYEQVPILRGIRIGVELRL